MSKEQTPINIQSELTSLYGKYGWSEMFLYKAQLLFDSESEKNANAKVLEALEGEFSKVDISMFDEDRSSDYIEQGKFYYETAVKPKYEKERKQRSN